MSCDRASIAASGPNIGRHDAQNKLTARHRRVRSSQSASGHARREFADRSTNSLATLKRRMPDTELRIMVGMAQGADLLVAQAALSAGWQVDAILPMPLDRYVEDFDSESSAALLTLLKDPSVHCTVLPAPTGLDQSAPKGVQRDALYANLTEALIDKCNVLLALWDGQPSSLPGGTADTVLRYLGARTCHGSRSAAHRDRAGGRGPGLGTAFRLLDSDDAQRRCGQPSPHEPSYLSGIGENLLAVHKAMPLALEQQLTELNTYNREFERLQQRRTFARLDSLMPTLGAIGAREDRDSLRAHRRRVRQGGCARHLLSAAFRPACSSGSATWPPAWRCCSSSTRSCCASNVLLILVSGDPRARRGGVPLRAQAAVVLEAPDLSCARRDDAHEVLPARGAGRPARQRDGADQSHGHRPVRRLQLDRQSAEEHRAARVAGLPSAPTKTRRASRACIGTGSAVSRSTSALACASSSAITADSRSMKSTLLLAIAALAVVLLLFADRLHSRWSARSPRRTSSSS